VAPVAPPSNQAFLAKGDGIEQNIACHEKLHWNRLSCCVSSASSALHLSIHDRNNTPFANLFQFGV
jgi:hypothetical protein